MSSHPLVPDTIQVRLRTQKGNPLYFLTKLERWSPFEAACIIRGLVPGRFREGVAEAYWDYDPLSPNVALEHFDREEDYGTDLRSLTIVIAKNARGAEELAPSEIVQWAIKTNMISVASELARTFIRRNEVPSVENATSNIENVVQSTTDALNEKLINALEEIETLARERDTLKAKTKETGKHFALIRERIYASALFLLARNRDVCIDSAGRAVAAKITDLIHDKRHYLGFEVADGDGENPAHSTVKECLEKALSGPLPPASDVPNQRRKKEVNLVTTD